MSKQQAKNPVSEKIGFFKDSWTELKKVHPPTREETWRTSLSVVFMLCLFGIFLGMTDLLVGASVRALLGLN